MTPRPPLTVVNGHSRPSVQMAARPPRVTDDGPTLITPRLRKLLDRNYLAGRADGDRLGYVRGWRSGFAHGAGYGLVLAIVAVVLTASWMAAP